MANYSLDNFVDPIMVLNRSGTSDDPFIQKVENLKVLNNSVVLDELPVSANGVVIEDMFERQLENDGEVISLADDEFYVDYRLGIVYFNGTQDNIIKRITYYGRGLVLYPIERFYRLRDGGDIEFFEDTINALVAKVDVLQQIVNNGSAVTSVNGKTGALALNANDVGAIDLNLPRVETVFKFIIGDEAIQLMGNEFDMGWISWYPVASAPFDRKARIGFMSHQSQIFTIENTYGLGQILMSAMSDIKLSSQNGAQVIEMKTDGVYWNGVMVATMNDINNLRTELNLENVSVNGDTMIGDLVIQGAKLINRDRVTTTVNDVPVNTDNDMVSYVDATAKTMKIYKRLNNVDKYGITISGTDIKFQTESNGTKTIETTEGAQTKATQALNDGKTYTDTKLNNLLNTVNGLKQTLEELSDALANDPNFATSITNMINQRATITYVDGQISTLLSNINTRETKTDATSKLNQAKAYTDTVFAGLPVNTLATQIMNYHGLGITNNARPIKGSAINVYVDSKNGSDSNSGSSSRPFKTIGRAVKELPHIIENGVSYINIRPGKYSETIQARAMMSSHSIIFRGVNFKSRSEIQVHSARVESNSVGSIYFSNMRFYGVAEVTTPDIEIGDDNESELTGSIHLDSAGRVYVRECDFARSSSEREYYGINAHGMTNVTIKDCYFYGLKGMVMATDGAEVFIKGKQTGGYLNYYAVIRSARVYKGSGFSAPKPMKATNYSIYGGQFL